MDGHDWSHEHVGDPGDHTGHDPLDLPEVGDPGLGHDHGLLDDWVTEHDHGHDPALPEDHPAPEYSDHGEVAELPADEISLEPDPAGTQDMYPPVLEVSVSPADGQPWVDPALLGTGEAAGLGADLGPEPPALFAAPDDLLASLHHTVGSDTAADWDELSGSEDPAVRSLADFWRPDQL